MDQVSNPESTFDDFMAALHAPDSAAFFEGVYTLAALQYLVQSLQRAMFADQAGMLVISSCATTQDWQRLFDLNQADQHSLLLLADERMPEDAFLIGMLGIQGGAVVYGTEQAQSNDYDQSRLFTLRWSFAPSAVEQTVDLIEQQLILTDHAQVEQWHIARTAFPLQQPDKDVVLRLFSDLLAFATRQHQIQATAYANLLARLRWYEDQTRMMVHDIRGPLHNMLASFKALLSQQLAPAMQHELLHVGYESALFLDNMIDTMMDALRLEAGKLPLHYEPLQIATLIRSVCEPFELNTRTDLPRLAHIAPDELPPLVADRRLIERVLNNLIDNAVKFTPSGGKVTISAQLADDQHAIEISVADTGRGIHPDAQPHIFKRFYQTKEKDRSRGVGLGLYFCRVAVEAHGGIIRFASTPGLGSTFIVVLPLQPADEDG